MYVSSPYKMYPLILASLTFTPLHHEMLIPAPLALYKYRAFTFFIMSNPKALYTNHLLRQGS